MEGKTFSLKSGNKTSFKNMGSSPLKHEKGGEEHKHLFEKATGKKFTETKFGKALIRGREKVRANVNDDIKGNLWSGVGKAVFTPEPHDNEAPKENPDGSGGINTDNLKENYIGEVDNDGNQVLQSSAGDPYSYRLTPDGDYQFKKGNDEWSTASGAGLENIKKRYEK